MAEATAKGLEGTVGPEDPDTLASLNSLALAYRDVARFPEAIALFERVRDANIAKNGPDHPETLTIINASPGRTSPPASSRRRSPCSSASRAPGSPRTAPTTPTR